MAIAVVVGLIWSCAFMRAANHGRASEGAMHYQVGRLFFQLVPVLALFAATCRAFATRWRSRHLLAISTLLWFFVVLSRGTVYDTERKRSTMATTRRELLRVWREMK